MLGGMNMVHWINSSVVEIFILVLQIANNNFFKFDLFLLFLKNVLFLERSEGREKEG